MQYRSAKYFWIGFSAAVASAAVFWIPAAQATLTVTPVNNQLTGLTNLVGSTFYYPSSNTAGPPPVLPGYNLINATILNPASDSAVGFQDMLFFQVSSSSTSFPSTGTTVLVIRPTGDSTNPPQLYIPIAMAGTSAPLSLCSPATMGSGLGNCANVNNEQYATGYTPPAATGNPSYYAVVYQAGQTITIGILLGQVCTDLASQQSANFVTPGETFNAATWGCAGAAPNTAQPVALTPLRFPMTFSIENESVPTSVATPGDPIGVGSTPSAADTATFTMNLQADPPTLSPCTAQSLANIYFPADGKIIVNTTQVSMNATVSGSDAPPSQMVIVASTTGFADITAAGYNKNNALQPTPIAQLNGVQTISGFTNSTPTQTVSYDIAFMIADASGLIAAPSAGTTIPVNPALNTTSCGIAGVTTSAIQGFLKSNKCFIATATYAELDNPALSLLRRFRDRVLLPSALGQAFVDWYYAWSPGAADWLLDHPAYRGVVLLALKWPEALAGVGLHPLLALILAACGASLLVGAAVASGLARHRRLESSGGAGG